MSFNQQQFRQFLTKVISVIKEQKDYLSELDRKLGDGDHGVTMSIGWQAVAQQLDQVEKSESISKLAIITGKTFLSAVGSSVGPLYATGFLRGAKAIQDKEILDDQDIYNFWNAFIDGVQERGKANIGDKTMMDTLIPAKEELQKANIQHLAIYDGFKLALTAAKQGMLSTKQLESKLGRSSRLGKRSIGHQDPGATSAYLILECFFSVLGENNYN